MGTNGFIHVRLSEGRFVTFIVAPTAVAHQVDQDILMELIAEGICQAYGYQACIGIISVHMDDGNPKTLGQVTCKMRRASLFRSSGKAKLIVDNNVDSTTNPVTREAPEVQGFGNNSFTWKSRIPMN